MNNFYRETLNDSFPREPQTLLEVIAFNRLMFEEMVANELAWSMQIPFKEESFQASLEAVAERRLDLTRHRR